MTSEPMDAGERARAMNELETSFLVEAGAGTGKTTILVERLVRLLERGTGMERIAAITFTEKAAAELKVRLGERLEECVVSARGSGDQALAERFERALLDLDRAQVTTIHGFCASILRERPVEAGVDPGFEVADADRRDVLFEEAFDQFLAELFAEESAGLRAALEAGIGLPWLRELCSNLIEQRDLLERLVLDKEEPADPQDVCLGFTELVRFLEQSRAACRKPDEDKLIPQIDRLSAFSRSLAGLSPLEMAARLLEKGVAGPKGSQGNWASKETLKECKERINAFRALLEERKEREKERRAVGLLRDLLRLPEAYERVKRRNRALDFSDLLIRTRDLLLRDTEVRRDFQRRFQAILLDEFQDTDPLQAEIAFFLAEDPGTGPAEDWSKVTVGKGRLFLVGDPKQSIYRFRRADIEVYQQAKERVVFSGGAVLKIQVNFRSAPAILKWVNRRFEKLLQPTEETASFQPGYVSIEQAPGATDLGPGVWLLRDFKHAPFYANAGEARAEEARWVAAFLKRAVCGKDPLQVQELREGRRIVRPARFGDCALLFRTSTAFSIHDEALRSNGIPYRFCGSKHLYSRVEVKAAVSLFRALDDPSDGIAQVATLRSPLFGVSDEDLVRFRMLGGRFDVLSSDPEGTPEALSRARELLRNLRRRRFSMGVARFVQEALEKTRALELFLLKPMGEQRVANLRSFVDRARKLEEAGRTTFRSFVEHIRGQELGRRDEEESSLLDEGDDLVQVMTIHKSKGLEFPIVVLCDLDGKARAGDSFLFHRGPPPVVAFSGASLRTPGFAELETRDRLREDAERRRLLYVAATRARCHLVLPHFRTEKGTSPLFVHLAEDPLFQAGEEEPCVVPRESLDLSAGTARPFRIDLHLAGPPGEKVERIVRERADYRSSLRGLFTGALHENQISSATASKHGAEPELSRGSPPAAAGRPAGIRGKEFGSLVHEILERIDHRKPAPDLERLARHRAALLGLDDGAARQAQGLVRSFLESDLADRVRAARRILPEVPFAFRADEGLFEGSIDLLLEEADGTLVVIDFKTDDVPPEDVKLRAAGYLDQGRLYSRAVEAVTGRPAAEVLFAFLRTGQVVQLAANGA
ncbi:MAG: UvrD-helicase domain-containing protein [Planctomycetota bacterium]